MTARRMRSCERVAGRRGGMLIKPTPSHTVSDYEWECVAFLCNEWDYGYDQR